MVIINCHCQWRNQSRFFDYVCATCSGVARNLYWGRGEKRRAEGAQIQRQKASRGRKWRGIGALGLYAAYYKRGSGQSPGRKQFWCMQIKRHRTPVVRGKLYF